MLLNSTSHRATLCLVTILMWGTMVDCLVKASIRTCGTTGFCYRNRAFADDMTSLGTDAHSPYTIIQDSILFSEGNSHLHADIENTNSKILFTLDVTILQDNTARVQINEKTPLHQRYDDHVQHTLDNPLRPVSPSQVQKGGEKTMIALDDTRALVIYSQPFKMEFLVDNVPVIIFNDRSFFNIEHLRTKANHKPKMIKEPSSPDVIQDTTKLESTMWAERFINWTDPKPNGPESIGLDISFPGFSHVYGIPSHASNLDLKETRGGPNAYLEPYRLFNRDAYLYELDTPFPLYGSVPIMYAHRKDISVGVFWMNPSDTWIDVTKTRSMDKRAPSTSKTALHRMFGYGNDKMNDSTAVTGTQTHWFSESGVLDIFVFFGPTPKDIVRQYVSLTGAPMMPPLFSIGYHQCRYNYGDEEEILDIDNNFDKNEIPYDVIWLDVDYTDGYKYFTWNKTSFPDPLRLQKQLEDKGRKIVIIIDPHIKRSNAYRLYREAERADYFIKSPSGDDFVAVSWPGPSSWVDYTNPNAINWWARQFAFDSFTETSENVQLWNDMNEPSIFDGPETTMEKQMVHFGGWEHRNLHNLYGMLMHRATAKGIRERTAIPKRPFVLARSFYAGSQRYGPVWTGDNIADWGHLAASTPMILTNGISGIPFSGADITGFIHEPSMELFTRWYQIGIYQPFFRAHSRYDSQYREPYLVAEPFQTLTRAAIHRRYALLPYWYTLFYNAYRTGTPMMRPMFFEFPEEESLFTEDNQFMVGDAILVKPITTEGAVSTNVYFPRNEIWYDVETYFCITTPGHTTVAAPLEKIPAYQRGGTIVPYRERPRRSANAMQLDPFTLVAALTTKGTAKGTLYIDDGDTYAFEHGAFAHTEFKYTNNTFSCVSLHEDPTGTDATDFAQSHQVLTIERIRIVGLKTQPAHARLYAPNIRPYKDLPFDYDKANGVLSVGKPNVSVIDCRWSIVVV